MEKRLTEIERQLTRLANQQKELVSIVMAEKVGLITVMAAEKIGFYSESQLRNFIRRGELKVYRPSKHRVLIDWKEFCEWLKRRSGVAKMKTAEPTLFGDEGAAKEALRAFELQQPWKAQPIESAGKNADEVQKQETDEVQKRESAAAEGAYAPAAKTEENAPGTVINNKTI